MTEYIQKKLSDKAWARWTVMFIVSFTMMCGYFVTDVMAPLESLLTSSERTVYFTDGTSMSADTLVARVRQANALTGNSAVPTAESVAPGQVFEWVDEAAEAAEPGAVVSRVVDSTIEGKGWTSTEYGFFSGAYGYINVLLLMLFFGGLILDKMGVRFTGVMSTGLMVAGALLKWYALRTDFGDSQLFGMHAQVVWASLGFSIYGVGCEIAGITVSKVIVKWFTGRELALAMGLQVGMARIGTAAALGASLPVARALGDVSGSVLLGVLALCIGLIAYLVFCVMDKKEDASAQATAAAADKEEGFRLKDLGVIFTSRGFWLITLLCLMFYAGVFPFIKFATKLMIYKYAVPETLAGLIPAMLPFGTILLTPLFGTLYDRIGRGATLMVIGSVLLTLVHVLFAMPLFEVWWFAVIVMVVLGIAFALVPSALWPSVPKIIPLKQLGSAYALIFYIQNIGLAFVPALIGWVINDFATLTDAGGHIVGYDYTAPMCIFALFGICAIVLSLVLLREDHRRHYGLEEANIK